MPMTPKEMISFLQKAGYVILSQNGSHVKMRNFKSGKKDINNSGVAERSCRA